jgi:hypothetical protein
MPNSPFNYKEYLTNHPELYAELDLANKTEDEWNTLLSDHASTNKDECDCFQVGPTGPTGPAGCDGQEGPTGPVGPAGSVNFDFVPIYTTESCVKVDLRENSDVNYVVYAPAKSGKQLNVDILHDESCIGKKGNVLVVNWDDYDISKLVTVPNVEINQENRILCRNARNEIDYCYEVGSKIIENLDDDDESNDLNCVVFQNDIKKAFSSSNKKLPVYNYDLFEITNQEVVYDSGSDSFYASANQSIEETVTLDSKKWFFKQDVTENIVTSDGNTFSIGGQWYYVNESKLIQYVSDYASAYKNDLSLLPHSENDITASNKNNTNLIYCVENCSETNKSFRKVRLTNVNIPLIAYEELTNEIDNNSSYTGNVPITLKGTVDFKVDNNVANFEVININTEPNNATFKQLYILKGTKKNCTLWGAFDMNATTNVGSLKKYKVNFNKSLILDRSLNSTKITGRWNKILDVVITSPQSSVQKSQIFGVSVTENGNPLNAHLDVQNVNEPQSNLVPMVMNMTGSTLKNSVLMTHYSYDVNLYNSRGNANLSSLPQFIARLNRFVSDDNKKLYSVQLNSNLVCTKQFGNCGNMPVV